ncbi:hypothetical protein AAKU52_003413 [Pedobacter sp. CG_S7]|uniref:hypothetical protein n=1 Tax=Pedobacter sp. CG_S7 TaxID=3143930 RepID=UPI00339B12F6
MDINYWWVSLALLAMILLISWLIRRNQKDKKVYEKEVMQTEIKPEKHDDEKI